MPNGLGARPSLLTPPQEATPPSPPTEQTMDIPVVKTKLPKLKEELPRAAKAEIPRLKTRLIPVEEEEFAASFQSASAPPSPLEFIEFASLIEVADEPFVKYIKDVEGLAGYDKKTKKYHIYTDVKGTPHIGYGHMLTPGEEEKFKRGISEEEVNRLLAQDLLVHANRAKQYVSAYYGNEAWKNLSSAQKQILTDYAFNPGLGLFPDFTEAVVQGDWEKAYSQMNRYAVLRDEEGNTKQVLPLKKRNERFYSQFLRPLREAQAAERILAEEFVGNKALGDPDVLYGTK